MREGSAAEAAQMLPSRHVKLLHSLHSLKRCPEFVNPDIIIVIEADTMKTYTGYLLFLLVAFLFCSWTAQRDIHPVEIRAAKVMTQVRTISLYHTPEHAVSLPVSGALASLGNRQLSARLSKGKFLVASRQIRDPRFVETVIFLVQHDLNGTVGLILNRPTTVTLSEFLPEMKEQSVKEHLTNIGGPVGMNQITLLIHSRDKIEGSQRIMDNVYVSWSKATLEYLIKNAGKETRFNAYAGYAGWVGGQLEHEISRGDWHVVQADAATIFDKPPSAVWPDLIHSIEVIRIEL